jgi:hypothetical protein
MQGLMVDRFPKRFLKGIRRKSKIASKKRNGAEVGKRSGNDGRICLFGKWSTPRKGGSGEYRNEGWNFQKNPPEWWLRYNIRSNSIAWWSKKNEIKGETIMNWITVIAGVILCLAPFVTGYSGTPSALWTSLIMGVVIAVLGFVKSYKLAAVAGVVTFIAPWIFGFNGIGAALWSCLVLGGVVVILDGYRGFFSRKGTETAQHA